MELLGRIGANRTTKRMAGSEEMLTMAQQHEDQQRTQEKVYSWFRSDIETRPSNEQFKNDMLENERPKQKRDKSKAKQITAKANRKNSNEHICLDYGWVFLLEIVNF